MIEGIPGARSPHVEELNDDGALRATHDPLFTFGMTPPAFRGVHAVGGSMCARSASRSRRRASPRRVHDRLDDRVEGDSQERRPCAEG